MRLSIALAKYFPGFFAIRMRNPVFIIGYPNSGKTLLARLLRQWPNVAYWSEANEIWDPKGYPWRTSIRETPPIWVDPVTYTTRWWRDFQPRQKEVQAIFGAYQWHQRKSCFLNETPLNTFRIPHLLQIFPDARFIHVVRDGRAAVYASTRKHYQKIQASPEPYLEIGLDYTFEELAVQQASYWKATLEEVAMQDQALRLSHQGILLELSYEELCAEPSATLNRACTHLGLNPSLLIPGQERLANRNNEWQREIDASLATRLIAAMDPTLTLKGYV